MTTLPPPRPDGPKADPQWYKDAVLYEIRVRSYFDSNGDGIGDLMGLASKLDYLQDLGVTAIWLLPICPSPGRDDGYDISTYTDVHPDVGTLADFRFLLDEAHRRGIRVITELVLNHTSDQHPWFQRARRAPPGSPERSFYVWSESIDRYKEARIIFKDFEPSNWSWDPVAGAHYWHRFYAHQPDLNFDNPAVHEALLDVVDFWFGFGVDGLRLDAVPYLYEREGTNCENLPETHAFLKKLRSRVDAKYEGRMLLAEANQWPEDAAAYFGDGDECHMNFHFPIMPRMFMAIRMEDRFPIIDIMAQTPQVHPSCQWALFLRNHDELTLEMVTDEERDYMVQAYAHEPAMRLNLGIRRRLAPLVGNDRRIMELLNGLLCSLPGTPVLYYGDEIGMGDNIFLGDRNGVRTPMQWSSDRNAGFSRANPQRLVLPVIIDPEYHFESVNVEAQQSNPSSLLWWTKRLVALRKRFHAFGRGSVEFLHPSNPRVLAYVRRYEEEVLLIVTNLSRTVQYVELDLARFKGKVPVELFGRTKFPLIGELPYLLTLGEHAFYWFSLEDAKGRALDERAQAYEPPTIKYPSIDGGIDGGIDGLLFGEGRGLLETILPAFLESRKWFGGRGKSVASVEIVESVALEPGVGLMFVRIECVEGEPETDVLVVGRVQSRPRESMRPPSPSGILARVSVQGPGGETAREELVDALEDPTLFRSIFAAISRSVVTAGAAGQLIASTRMPIDLEVGEARLLTGDHRNPTAELDHRFFLKVYRKLEEGRSPELELAQFLAERAPGLVPAVGGAIEYQRGREERITIAVLERFVPNEGTAWDHARRELGRFYERVLARSPENPVPALPAMSVGELASGKPPDAVLDMMGTYLDTAALLGRRTAEMHIALASSADDPALRPEPYTVFDRRSRYQSLRNLAGRTFRLLRARLSSIREPAAAHARRVVENETELFKRFEPMLREPLSYVRIRCHGDFHLGQALYTGKDFVLIDFDGGHERALTERRRKRSAMRDVASVLRSFHYAAFTVLRNEAVVRVADRPRAMPWGSLWQLWASASLLGAYLATAGEAPFLPREREQLPAFLESFVLERMLVELGSELGKESDAVAIPLHALVHLLGLQDANAAP